MDSLHAIQFAYLANCTLYCVLSLQNIKFLFIYQISLHLSINPQSPGLPMMDSNCIFCKIISGTIPCYKIAESASALAFLDISPITKSGHILVIPKAHAQFMHQVPEEPLTASILLAKKVASACFPSTPYNLLHNNGREAHQAVDHCHFHLIPKCTANGEGLEMKWDSLHLDQDALSKLQQQLTEKIKLHS